VSHLLLSPLTKGLIHRVIAASGSSLDFWATSSNPIESAMRVAAVAGCTTNVLECMLNKTQFELTVAQNITQVRTE
jgi:carboxylesterase type B